jgi:hypothetical protein
MVNFTPRWVEVRMVSMPALPGIRKGVAITTSLRARRIISMTL